jgi:hypothetical protein
VRAGPGSLRHPERPFPTVTAPPVPPKEPESDAPAGAPDPSVPPPPAADPWTPPEVDRGEAAGSGGFLPGILRFFVVPLVLVGASLAVFAGLGALVKQGSTPTKDLLDRVAEGGKNERWQAAMELANRVVAGEVDPAADDALAERVVVAFRAAREGGDDPRVLHLLSRFLAASPREDAGAALAEAAGDANAGTRIFALDALARRGDASSLDAALARTGDTDPAVRAMAVYATGILAAAAPPGDTAAARAAEPLRAALGDDAVDVRWNATLALSRLGIPGGEDELWRMLHPEYLRRHVAPQESGAASLFSTEGADTASVEERTEGVLLNALSAVWRRRDVSMIEGVRALASAELGARVRDRALRTLEALEAEAKAKGGATAPRAWTEADARKP